jgi:hypothetical protein
MAPKKKEALSDLGSVVPRKKTSGAVFYRAQCNLTLDDGSKKLCYGLEYSERAKADAELASVQMAQSRAEMKLRYAALHVVSASAQSADSSPVETDADTMANNVGEAPTMAPKRLPQQKPAQPEQEMSLGKRLFKKTTLAPASVPCESATVFGAGEAEEAGVAVAGAEAAAVEAEAGVAAGVALAEGAGEAALVPIPETLAAAHVDITATGHRRAPQTQQQTATGHNAATGARQRKRQAADQSFGASSAPTKPRRIAAGPA